MDEQHEVRDITIDRERQRMVVLFGDGVEHAFTLQDLRVHCPCAGCRGDREQGRTPWPKAGNTVALSVDGAELVGAWGLSITWNDGHRAGIYPFSSLRLWGDEGEAPVTPDSGLRT